MTVSRCSWSRKSRTCLPLYRQNAQVAVMTELNDIPNNQDPPTQTSSTTAESDPIVSESDRKGIVTLALLLLENIQLIALVPSSSDPDNVNHQYRILGLLRYDPEDTDDGRFKRSQYESGQSIIQEFLVISDIDY